MHLVSLLSLFRNFFQSRGALQMENLALRHHLNVLRRAQKGHIRLRRADRIFWVWLSKVWSDWRSALVIVKPKP